MLGALLEKQRTVPDSYPLSLNSLRTACNQSTSRDPVVAYDEATIVDALNRLRDRELVRFVKPTGLRVVKYHQRLEEQLGLDAPGLALVTASAAARGRRPRASCVRGPSGCTPSPTGRPSRRSCTGWRVREPPLVRELERQAGQHDRRWIHLLGAELPPEAVEPVRRGGPRAGAGRRWAGTGPEGHRRVRPARGGVRDRARRRPGGASRSIAGSWRSWPTRRRGRVSTWAAGPGRWPVCWPGWTWR